MDWVEKFLRDCFTGRDSKTWDIGRILWALSVIVYLSLAIWDVAATHTFEYQEFGIGIGAVLAGGGLGINLKKSTEP